MNNNNTPIIDPYTTKERHQPSPGLAALRRLTEHWTTRTTQRSHRKPAKTRTGLAQTQLLILGAVIAVLIILSGAGFAIYRSVTSGAEDRAAKDTVDRIIAETENYWQQYALDRSGKRQIVYEDWCEYLNRQFTTGTDLTLRAADTPAGVTVGSLADADAETAGEPAADCDGPTGSTGTAVGLGEYQDNQLGNSRSAVLIDTQATTGNWVSGTNTPGGTSTTDTKLEIVSVATISSTGNTFCAVYVLDANDRALIGTYRFAGSSSGGNVTIPGQCVGKGTITTTTGDFIASKTNNPWPQ